MLPNLERETAIRLGQIDQRLSTAQALSDERLRLAERDILERSREQLLKEATGHGRRWIGGLALGFIVASLAVWFAVGTVFPQLVTHYSNLDAAVTRAVQIGNAPVLEQLRVDLRSSRADMDVLKQQLSDLQRKVETSFKQPPTGQPRQETR